MSTIDELLKANETYAATFDRGNLLLPPARGIAIVTCMDARILPSRALGLQEGDAHVIRNAGGRARDALRSLIISQRLWARGRWPSFTTPTAACSRSTTGTCGPR